MFLELHGDKWNLFKQQYKAMDFQLKQITLKAGHYGDFLLMKELLRAR